MGDDAVNGKFRRLRARVVVRGLAIFGMAALSVSRLIAQSTTFEYDLSGDLGLITSPVSGPPQILGQPQQQVVAPGDLASFSVLLLDATGCSYQWLFNGTTLTGQTSDTLLFSRVTTNNQGGYSVVIVNSSGSVTSSVAPLYIDSRGSGMPDSWQMTFFGNLNQNASGDFDGDGVSNLQEFLDGTNPKDPSSFRSRLTVFQDGGAVTVSPDQPSYAPTNIVTLSGTALPPNTFLGWTGDLTGSTNPATLLMNTNKTVRAVFECFPPTAGLVGWWRGEGDVTDAAGGHTGVFYSGTNAMQPSFNPRGMVGAAFQFYGTNYIQVPDSADLRLNQFTLEGWVNLSASSQNYQTVIAKGSAVNDDDAYYVGVVNGTAAFWSKHGGSMNSLFGGSVPANQWVHLAATFDGATKRLYVNGVQVAGQSGLAALTYDPQQIPLTLGSDWVNGGPGYLLGGSLDEFSLFNRALNPSEVMGIVVASIGGKCASRPVFTTSPAFPDALQNTAYSLQISNIFGVSPVTFSLSAGALPPGLTLSSSGLVSGVPALPGSRTFAVLATDAAGVSTELICNLRVIARPALGPTMPPGIVSWWRAENNALDWVGTNNGTLSNGVSFVAGEVGQAFSFNGATNQEVFVPASSSLNLGTGPGLTMEGWIKPTSVTNQQPLAEWHDGVVYGSHFWINVGFNGQGGPGTLYANLKDSNQSDHFFFSATGLISTSSWQHVALSYDNASGIASMYLNGTMVSTAILGSFTPRTSPNFYLGGSPGFYSYSGLMDEMAVYNRSLSGKEILALYYAGTSGKVSSGPYLNTLSNLADGVLQSGYTQSITALSASGPVSFAVGHGALPPGITLSSSGVLSGVPTAIGSYTFSIVATDTAQIANSATYNIQVFAPVLPPAGLIGWWRGENNALDELAQHNGKLQGNATYGPGRDGTAFKLDGNNSYVDLGAWSAGPTWTLEAWVKPAALPNGRRTIFGNMANCLDWGLVQNNGELGAQIRPPGGCSSFVGSGVIPAINSWYHLAETCDGNTASVYVNGVLLGTAPVDPNYIGDPTSLRIGSAYCCGEYFQGSVDEVAIYNRPLASNEVAAIYSAGAAGKITTGPYFVTPGLLPMAVLNQAYTQAVLTARGTSPVNLAVTAGSLPPGVSLSAAGQLAGAPSSTGTFTFTVTATDAANLSARQDFSVTVLAQVPPAAGIVGWWRGENDTLDAIGTNNAVLINSATFGPGKVGAAFTLNGAGDAVEIEDAPALRPNSVTLEAWVLFLSAGGVQSIMTKPLGTGTADSYQIWLENGSLKGMAADISGAASPISVPFSPTLNQWYHLAFTFDDTTKQQVLYINSTPVAFGVANVTIGYDSHAVFLGADVENGNMALFLRGSIDEAAIYARALNPSEISAIYNAGAAGRTITGPYIAVAPALPDGALGVSYSQNINSARSMGTVTFSVTSGALPSGLTVNAQGVLSGTPKNPGLFTFTLRATDSTGLYAEERFSLRVAAPIPPVAGLISWWRAEGDATDSIGTNNGTAFNGTSYGAGEVGQAFVFDGINDYVGIPDSPSLRPNSLTIDCWVRFEANPGITVIMSKPLGSGILDSFALWVQNGSLFAVISANNGSAPALSTPFTPVLQQWYHLAFTFDGYTRQQVLYLNNVSVAAGTADRSIAYDNHSMLLGCDSDSGNRTWFLKGRIDEASIYNRALTAQEVTGLYYAGAAGKALTGPFFTTSPTLPDATTGRSYGQALAAARGTGQLTYTLTSGTLPNGLSLTTAGLISGTPTAPGTFSFLVRVTDSTGLFAEQSYSISAFTPIAPLSGMIGWWRGENNALDELGFHNGTLQGNASYGPGRVGSAFVLDGINSYVDLGAWNAGSNWTLEAWVNPSTLASGRHTVIGCLNSCLDWGLEMTDGQLGGQIRPPGGCSSFIGSGVFPSTGFWYHLAMTCDGTNATVYVNGILSGAAPVDVNYLGSPSGLRIGSSICCGEYFPGSVDEVSIYNRALAPSEIAMIYNAGAGGKTAGLIIPTTTPPTLSAALVNGTSISVTFNTNPGNPYTLEYQDALSGPSWTTLTNFTAFGTNFIYNYSIQNAQQRFLRVHTTAN